MEEGFKAFWQCFVPLFVAVDAIGVLPMFMALTEGLDRSNPRRIINQSVVTAAVVGLSFLIAGVVFRSTEAINRILGNAGTRIVSKVASLLLAAIAVMIVRKGVESLVSSHPIGS